MFISDLTIGQWLIWNVIKVCSHNCWFYLPRSGASGRYDSSISWASPRDITTWRHHVTSRGYKIAEESTGRDVKIKIFCWHQSRLRRRLTCNQKKRKKRKKKDILLICDVTTWRHVVTKFWFTRWRSEVGSELPAERSQHPPIPQPPHDLNNKQTYQQ